MAERDVNFPTYMQLNNKYTEAVYELRDKLFHMDFKELDAVVSLIRETNNKGGTIWTMGNGGSAANAAHFSEDLGLVGVDSICLASDAPRLTALANDFGYENVFSNQLAVLAKPNDMVVVFSVSGNSDNVLHAIEVSEGMTSVGFLGMDGGEAKNFLNYAIVIPSQDFGIVETAHQFICHVIVSYLMNENRKTNSA